MREMEDNVLSMVLLIATVAVVGLPLGGCNRLPYQDVHDRVTQQCLAEHGGPEWAARHAEFHSLAEFCDDKGEYERQLYMKVHDHAAWEREH
jgi:hypothetical protein